MYKRGFSCTLYDVVLIYDQRMKRLKFAVILGAVDGGRGLVVNQNRIMPTHSSSATHYPHCSVGPFLYPSRHQLQMDIGGWIFDIQTLDFDMVFGTVI